VAVVVPVRTMLTVQMWLVVMVAVVKVVVQRQQEALIRAVVAVVVNHPHFLKVAVLVL